MIYLLFLLVSAVIVFYYSYTVTWFHISGLFESSSGLRASKYSSISSNDFYISNPISKLITSDEYFNSTNKNVIEFLKKSSRIVFSLSLTNSVVIIEFILFQVITVNGSSVTDESVAIKLWNANLMLLIASLVLVQPALISFLLVNKFFKTKLLNITGIKCLATLSIMIFWLFVVVKFQSFTDLQVSNRTIFEENLISYFSLRVSVIGVTLISILNGIGSYSTVYYFAKGKFGKRIKKFNHSDLGDELKSLEKNLENTETLIKNKETELEKLNQTLVNSSNHEGLNKRSNIQPKSSFLDLKSYFKDKSNDEIEQDELAKEIYSLKVIKNDIYLKLLNLESNINTSASTDGNVLIKIVGLSITTYCFFKLTQVIVLRLILSKFKSNDINSNESDPLVITISKLIQLVVTVKDENSLVNQLSFVISGGLFMASLNGVFLTFRHLYKLLPLDLSSLNDPGTKDDKRKSVSIIKNLLVSELTGVYILATILILKSNLKQTIQLGRLFLVQDDEGGLIENWFDKMFLISAFVTCVGIKIGEYLSSDIDGFENDALLDKIV